MPHQCTSCGRTFADGSKEMLSGCPDCGGNKFQFKPEGTPDTADTDGDDPAEPQVAQDPGQQEFVDTGSENPAQRDAHSTAPTSEEMDVERRNTDRAEQKRLGEYAAESRALEQSRDEPESTNSAADPHDLQGTDPADQPADDPVEPPGTDPNDSPETNTVDPPETDLSALRDELNDQFESIKITAPGQYELNLMELYDRKEFIISLQEDGRYIVDIPEGAEHRD